MRAKGLPGASYHLARHRPPDLSAQASQRLGLPRSTLYRWQQRLQRQGPKGLEERSRAPQRRRPPTWGLERAQAVLGLREQRPCWGKDKLVVLLRRQGIGLSTSRVGRVLTRLKARGVLPAGC